MFRVVALLSFGGVLREGYDIIIFTRKINPPCYVIEHQGFFAVHGKCDRPAIFYERHDSIKIGISFQIHQYEICTNTQ